MSADAGRAPGKLCMAGPGDLDALAVKELDSEMTMVSREAAACG